MPTPPSETTLYFLDWLPVAGPPLDPNRCGIVHTLPDNAQRGIPHIMVLAVQYIVRGDGLFLAAVRVRYTKPRDKFRIASLMRALSSAIKEDRGHVHVFHEKAPRVPNAAERPSRWREFVLLLLGETNKVNVGLHPPVMVADPYDLGLAKQLRARDAGFAAPDPGKGLVKRGEVNLLPDMDRCFANPVFVAHLREEPVPRRSRRGLTAIQALRYEILNQRDAALELYSWAGARTKVPQKWRLYKIFLPMFVLFFVWAVSWLFQVFPWLFKSIFSLSFKGDIHYWLLDILNIQQSVHGNMTIIFSSFTSLFFLILLLAYHNLKIDMEGRLKILAQADGYQKTCAPFFHAAQVIFAAGGGRAGDAPGYMPGDVFAPLIKRIEIRMMRHSVIFQMIVGLLGAMMAVLGVVVAFKADVSSQKPAPSSGAAASSATPPAIAAPAPAPSPAAAICPPESSVTICLPPAKDPR